MAATPVSEPLLVAVTSNLPCLIKSSATRKLPAPDATITLFFLPAFSRALIAPMAMKSFSARTRLSLSPWDERMSSVAARPPSSVQSPRPHASTLKPPSGQLKLPLALTCWNSLKPLSIASSLDSPSLRSSERA
ncbi:hypothetical protein D3C87_1417400 [compost metagenome]